MAPTRALTLDVEISPISPASDFTTSAPIVFTSINPREIPSPSNAPGFPSSVTCRELKGSGLKRAAGHFETIAEKKQKTALENDGRANVKRLAAVQTPTQTPLPSWNIIKRISKSQEENTIQNDNYCGSIVRNDSRNKCRSQAGGLPTSIERVAPLSPGSYSPTFKVTGSYNHTGMIKRDPVSESPQSVGVHYKQDMDYEATIRNGDVLTLNPTAATDQIVSTGGETTPFKIASEQHIVDAYDWKSDLSDAYPLDDDIAQILADPSSGWVQENHIPPSSMQGWDHDSRSAMEYDPNLKFSPPNVQEPNHDTAGPGGTSATQQTNASEDLLDEDVDWNAVLANANNIQKNSSIGNYSHVEAPKAANEGPCEKSLDRLHSQVSRIRSSPGFVRPPFPGKIRDRPSVPGMSSDTLLRTCFRIGAMISQTVCCAKHQQDVVFELYARVTYSSRERSARKQHFQFVDLSKDQQPYPAATLTNWRAGSQLDIDSAAFLDTSGGPRLCWCMCKPVRDPKAAVGWTYAILRIRETDWEQIHWAMRVVCGNPEKSSDYGLEVRL